MNRTLRTSALFAFLLLGGCYRTGYIPTTANYVATPRDAASVRITSEHPGPEYAEVGLLSGSGPSFEGAIKRIKDEAGARGCDVVYLLGEAIQSGYGTPGGAYGATQSHIRAACFVAAARGVQREPRAPAAALASGSQPVPSPPVGNDLVLLKGGGMIRGTLLEVIPQDHATVALVNGQTEVIPWDRIDHVERAGVEALPPPVAAPATPSSPLPPPRSSEVVPVPAPTMKVHLASDRSLWLEGRNPSAAEEGSTQARAWSLSCTSPCDAELPVDREYRIRGNSLRPTPPFRLAGRAGDTVTLRVTGASKGLFTGGIALLAVGGAGVIAGLFFVALEVDPSTFGTAASARESTSPGVVTALVGAGVALVGAVLLGTHVHSTVQQGETGARKEAWRPLPSWREDPLAAGAPKMAGVPIVGGVF